jgi:hypothetical protein
MNKQTTVEKIDITPDKTIYHKIGEANYSISDAIAELVDNSIDAAGDDGVEVLVILDKDNEKIIIEDDGTGMNKEAASKCLVLAHSRKQDSLGEFGLGLKSACTSLGQHFSVSTKHAGSDEKYLLEYDREEFLRSADWSNYPLNISKSAANEHGTVIEISKLKIKLYDALVTRLKDDLSKRYGPYIKHNNVIIKVGLKKGSAKPCQPAELELVDNKKIQFKYKLVKGGEIYGWYGLLMVGSQKQSGFNMFRRGRLIRASEKLGYNYHPSKMSIIGEINLDPVPVTHNKREFIVESGEFREFIQNFWGDQTDKYLDRRVKGIIDEITKLATDRANQQKADAMPVEKRETLKSKVLQALNRLDEFKELAFPELNKKKRSEKGISGEIEQRNTDLRVAKEEPLPEPERENDQRVPKKTQPKTAKFIMVGGQKFRFDFYLQNLGNDTMDKETIITAENVIEVYINTGFKGYILTKDTDFYATFHIAEAIAGIYVKEAKQATERIFELRNNLIHEVAAVILEEEDLRRIEKAQQELEILTRKKKEIEEKRKKTSLV